jgi:glycosyltransferase involved in cell wall biosynthesis
MAGLEACLKLGADVIVNTDADNQYDASYIPALVMPIVEGKADIVIGARPISQIPHFSPVKKLLQKLGSWAVRVASKTDIPDAPSGFRAIHRDAAMRLNVFSNYTYTLETIIQAGRKNMRITSVEVGVNEDLRPSRLVKSIPSYVQRSIGTIFRIFLVYKPFRAFSLLGLALLIPAVLLGLRFLWSFILGEGAAYIQSLILAAILSIAGFISFATAVLADLLAVNRTLLEDLKLRMLRLEVDHRPEAAVGHALDAADKQPSVKSVA